MRCSDENYYVVKFRNNPQHLRVLVNEMLASRPAERAGLRMAEEAKDWGNAAIRASNLKLAVNPLGDECFATPAIDNGQLYIRTQSALYRFGQPAGNSKSQ